MKTKTCQLYPRKSVRNGPTWRPTWGLSISLTKAGFLMFFKICYLCLSKMLKLVCISVLCCRKNIYISTLDWHTTHHGCSEWCSLAQRLILLSQLGLTEPWPSFRLHFSPTPHSACLPLPTPHWVLMPYSLLRPYLGIELWKLILLAKKAEASSLLTKCNGFWRSAELCTFTWWQDERPHKELSLVVSFKSTLVLGLWQTSLTLGFYVRELNSVWMVSY